MSEPSDSAVCFTGLREKFAIPRQTNGSACHYFCGNSLGLMPYSARECVNEALDAWEKEGVEGHFNGAWPWMPYHEFVRSDLAALVGAKEIEVVAMNTLSVNLHLLMASFYRPTASRHIILMEARAFPSDRHAVESQIRWHGFEPNTSLIELSPEPDSDLISAEQIDAAIATAGEQLALVLMPGVQYATGQAFDLKQIAKSAHAVGAMVGFDLAHAVGNLALQLHDSGIDFAVWCSYKYLNSGPGAVAGAFVHERHAHSQLPRLAGWWGHRKDTRFQMGPNFEPIPGAEGWQLSNPPIFSLAPLRASLALFRSAGMPALRKRSLELTGHLESGLTKRFGDHLQIITPSAVEQRGCQLSVRVRQQGGDKGAGRACFQALQKAGVIADWREPDVIRLSPVPMYNQLDDIDALLTALAQYFLGAKA